MNEVDTYKDYLVNVVKSFSPGIRYAFAYGSGVFKQDGHVSIGNNMIDFIFVVNDAFSWHAQTLDRYPTHYSFLKHFGPHTISNIQKNFGAKIYFNTLVEFEGRSIKYGVIDLDAFNNDLQNWETMYVAGRLHKPVLSLKGLDDPAILKTVKFNLRSAVEASLLTLPERFTEEELYLQIAGLSYSGDVRMIIGEDKKKVRNIVLPNIHNFRDLYSDIVDKSRALHRQNGIIEQDFSPEVQGIYLKRLPWNLRSYVMKRLGVNVSKSKTETIDENMIKKIVVERAACDKAVSKGIHSIIRSSSTTQTVKGIATSGVNKSLVYSLQKLKKMFKSLK